MHYSKLPDVRGNYRLQADLSKRNWFGVGGKADILYRPSDVDDLVKFLKEKPKDLAYTMIGVGSNLLIRDGGIEGVVISLGRAFTDISINENQIIVGAGALNYNVATLAKNHGLSGLEFLIGIPGSIGGGLAMNAGANGSDISQVLSYAKLLDTEGNIHTLTPNEIGYRYREHNIPEGWIFIEAAFQVHFEPTEKIEARMQTILDARLASQPVKSRTCGSVFMNPPGEKAWRLIEAAGCRGLVYGGAQVSELHCNFLINMGNASAIDIETLGELVKQRVLEKTGYKLEWEIKRIGRK